MSKLDREISFDWIKRIFCKCGIHLYWELVDITLTYVVGDVEKVADSDNYKHGKFSRIYKCSTCNKVRKDPQESNYESKRAFLTYVMYIAYSEIRTEVFNDSTIKQDLIKEGCIGEN